MYAYLINTQALTQEDRKETERILNTVGAIFTLRIKPDFYGYLVTVATAPAEFMALQFPNGCIITDITGQDLTAYR